MLLLGSAGADGSQRVIDKNLGGGVGNLLDAWKERRRHGRAPPDAEEEGGWDVLRDSTEVELWKSSCQKFSCRAITYLTVGI